MRRETETGIRLMTINRRDFLRTASAATLSALAAGAPRQLFAAGDDTPRPTADTLIILWMAGGMSHVETFDPKRYAPYTSGMRSADMLCTFPAIDTSVDNVKISE